MLTHPPLPAQYHRFPPPFPSHSRLYNSSAVPAASKANTMPRRLPTTWATLTRTHPLGQEDYPEQVPEFQPIDDVLPLD